MVPLKFQRIKYEVRCHCRINLEFSYSSETWRRIFYVPQIVCKHAIFIYFIILQMPESEKGSEIVRVGAGAGGKRKRGANINTVI